MSDIVMRKLVVISFLSILPTLSMSQALDASRAESLALLQEGKRLSAASRLEDAENVLLRALRLCPNAQPYEHACASAVSSTLGDVKVKAGDLIEAEVYLQQSLAAAERGFPAKDPWIVERLFQLGDIYRRQSKLLESESILKRSANIAEQNFSKAPQLLARAIEQLLLLFYEKMAFEEAVSTGLAALDLFKSERRISPDVLMSISLMVAHSMAASSRYTDAENLYLSVVNTVKEERANPRLSMLADILVRIARIRISDGRSEGAKAALFEAITIAAKLKGGRNADFANACSILAEIYQKQGNVAESEAFLRCSVALTASLGHREGPQFALLLSRLAEAVAAQHHYNEAQELLRRAVEILGPDPASGYADVARARDLLNQAARDAAPAQTIDTRIGRPATDDLVPGMGISVARIEAEVAFALRNIGESGHAEAVLARSIRSATLDRDRAPAAVGAFHHLIADDLWSRAEKSLARNHIELAVAAFAIAPDADAANHIEALVDLGQLLEKDDEIERGAALVKRALLISPSRHIGTKRLARDAVALANRLHSRGLYAGAIDLWTPLARLAEADADTELISIIEGGIAAACYEMGRYQEAERFAARAFEREIHSPGTAPHRLADYGQNLAYARLATGRADAAEAPAEQSLAITEQLFGDDDQRTAEALHLLSHVKLALFRFADSEAGFRRVLAIRGRRLGATHIDYGKSLAGLAAVLDAQGRYGEAESLHRSAVVIEQLATGRPARSNGRYLAGLARNALLQGRVDEADQSIRRSLKLLEEAVGDDPALAARLVVMAEIAAARGDDVSALAIRQRALALQEKADGVDNPALTASLLGITGALVRLDRLEEASDALARAGRLLESNPGSYKADGPLLLETAAVLDAASGRLAEAEAKGLDALAARMALVGNDHPSLVAALNNLGCIYMKRLNFDQAERVLSKALRIQAQTGGERHPRLIPILSNLFGTYSAVGRHADARETQTRLKAIVSADRPVIGKPRHWL